jgi:hypothetical protein
MHLSTLYARDLGVFPSKPIIKEHFFPLPCEKYITFHNSEKIQSKSYSYWTEVFDILKKYLDPFGIKIVQVGAKEDKKVEGVHYYLNNTTFKQSFFIIKNGLLHLGIDSSPAHIASAYNKPTVSIYAHTYANTCFPLWNENKIMIEPERGRTKPSFSLVENPKTIDKIEPEVIVQATLNLLGINQTITYRTLNIGKFFLDKEINVIPDEIVPQVDVDNASINIRLDMIHDESFLIKFLNKNSCNINIYCSNPIENTKVLMSYKSKINKINYYSNAFNADFVYFLTSNVFDLKLLCTSPDSLNEQRLNFFDHEIDLFDLVKISQENKSKYFELVKNGIKIKTGRIYVKGQEQFKTIGENFDDWKFWLDFDHMMVYNE